jgi:hypothetical protein
LEANLDNIFLENVAETYLTDRQIKNIDSKQVFEDLINFRNNIRIPESDFNFINDILLEEESVLNRVELLYEFLDFKYLEESLTAILLASGAGLTALAYAVGLLDKPITILLGQYLLHVRKLKKWIVNTKLFKSQSELNDRYKIVEKLMDSNYSQCSILCGSPNIKDPFTIVKTMNSLFNSDETQHHQYIKNDTLPQDLCLLSCVLDYLSTAIAQLNLIYDRCLSNTGEKPNKLSSGTNRVIMPIGSECKALADDLNDCVKDFNLILDRVYHNNPRTKATWIDILNQKIDDVKSNKKITNYGPLAIDTSSPHHQMINFNSAEQGRL